MDAEWAPIYNLSMQLMFLSVKGTALQK